MGKSKHPKAIFGSKLFPIDVVLFEVYKQESAWCFYFAKKLRLVSVSDDYDTYEGSYEDISVYGKIAVSTGIHARFNIDHKLIFSPDKAAWIFKSLTCRRIK